jgi:F-type H+-transporting ATPase subunit a
MRKLFVLSALSLITAFIPQSGFLVAQDDAHEQHLESDHQQYSPEHGDGEFNPTEMIMHHIGDSHGFHVMGEGASSVSVPLPVILWTDEGLVTFSSSEFHHDIEGHHGVERKGMTFLNYHEKIYIAGPNGGLEFDEEHHPINEQPLDLSITKNVFTLLLAGFLLCLIFMSVARSYKSNKGTPRGLTSFMEPLVLFVRDDIARPQIGDRYERYMPFLLTIFFLIWLLNLMGLVPFFPFSANVSGNIAFTLTLAVFSLIIVQFSGNRHYWKHIFAPNPWWLWPILFPIELASNIVIKFFALMIRLFANITAGHIIVLSLISLIFIFQNVAMAGLAVPFALFISILELLVAALQAFIFTMLTALFIGQATAEHH